MWRVISLLFKLSLLIIAPFVVLIRGAVYFHQQYHWNAWLCLLGGVIVTSFVLVIYLWLIEMRLLGRRPSSFKRKMIIVAILVGGYALHGLLFLSSNNTKYAEVQREFKRLHPILRVAISTLIHVDKELLITDAERKPEDYRKMGLASKKRSLHYPQASGYVHAVDIRTNQRSAWRNTFTQLYFRLMGFRTLRHVGTADHLHVSLYSRSNPGAI